MQLCSVYIHISGALEHKWKERASLAIFYTIRFTNSFFIYYIIVWRVSFPLKNIWE